MADLSAHKALSAVADAAETPGAWKISAPKRNHWFGMANKETDKFVASYGMPSTEVVWNYSG